MRIIRTFVLRLWIDTDEPATLRGGLQAVGENDTHPFSGEQALLALLSRYLEEENQNQTASTGSSPFTTGSAGPGTA